jgi:hypothetical protein
LIKKWVGLRRDTQILPGEHLAEQLIVAALEAKVAESPERKRTLKRKAPAGRNDSPESEPAFSDMDVDEAQQEEGEGTDVGMGDEEPETPQPLEDEETASEASDEERQTSPPSRKNGNPNTNSTRPGLVTPATPPPRRDLPFGNKARSQQKAADGLKEEKARAQESTDEESGDDEL